MTLCDDGHKEVCFEGRVCPACVLKDENKELKDQIVELTKQLDEATSE